MEYPNPLLNCSEIHSNSMVNSVANGNPTTGLSGAFLNFLQISQVLEISSTDFTISSSSCHNLDVLINCFNLFELQWQNCRCNFLTMLSFFSAAKTCGEKAIIYTRIVGLFGMSTFLEVVNSCHIFISFL